MVPKRRPSCVCGRRQGDLTRHQRGYILPAKAILLRASLSRLSKLWVVSRFKVCGRVTSYLYMKFGKHESLQFDKLTAWHER